MRILLILLACTILLSGCCNQISNPDFLTNYSSSDSCGGAGVPIAELKSYCAQFNFDAVKIAESNGTYALSGIEDLRLEGFSKNDDLLKSSDYVCWKEVDPDGTFVVCNTHSYIGSAVFERPIEGKTQQIVLWTFAFDADTNKLKEADCWCDS